MGKKNKAKAQFNAQRELVSALRTACEPLPSDIPVFSVSRADDGPYREYDINEYGLFLVAVQDLQSADDKPQALAEFWKRAYSLGKQDGQGMDPFEAALCDDEVQQLHDDAWQEGYEDGSNVGEKHGYEKGMKDGITKMEEVFVGHVSIGECSAGRSLRVDAAVNTEQAPLLSNTAVQTLCVENDNSPVTNDQSRPQTFSWATDALSLPIYQPPNSVTRNINALRTEGVSKPFSSLQRRAHAQRKQRKPKSIPGHTGQPTPQQCTCHPSSIPVFTVTYSVPPASTKLDWDHDPRLIQLSIALRSLGWSPPS